MDDIHQTIRKIAEEMDVKNLVESRDYLYIRNNRMGVIKYEDFVIEYDIYTSAKYFSLTYGFFDSRDKIRLLKVCKEIHISNSEKRILAKEIKDLCRRSDSYKKIKEANEKLDSRKLLD